MPAEQECQFGDVRLVGGSSNSFSGLLEVYMSTWAMGSCL